MTWASPTESENPSHSCDSRCALPYDVDVIGALAGRSSVGKGWDLAVTPQHVAVWVSAEENKAIRGSDQNGCLTVVKSAQSLKDTAIASEYVVRGQRTIMLGIQIV